MDTLKIGKVIARIMIKNVLMNMCKINDEKFVKEYFNKLILKVKFDKNLLLYIIFFVFKGEYYDIKKT